MTPLPRYSALSVLRSVIHIMRSCRVYLRPVDVFSGYIGRAYSSDPIPLGRLRGRDYRTMGMIPILSGVLPYSRCVSYLTIKTIDQPSYCHLSAQALLSPSPTGRQQRLPSAGATVCTVCDRLTASSQNRLSSRYRYLSLPVLIKNGCLTNIRS